MDELTALRVARDGFGPYRDGPSPAVAERVLDRTRSGSRRWPGRRTALRLPGRSARWLLPVAAAAAVGSLVVGIGLQFRDGPVGSVAVPAAPERPASLDGRTVLRAAADRARSQTLPSPDPAGFVYTRETGTSPREVWLPVDGKRPGLVLAPGARPSREDLTVCAGGPAVEVSSQDCAGPGYLTDIPADRAGALAALQEIRNIWNWGFTCRRGEDESSTICGDTATDAELLERAGYLLGYRMLPPASRAAVLEALSEIRGLQVWPELVTIAGRRGIGVFVETPSAGAGTPDEVEVSTLVLDPTTYDPIGLRSELRSAPVAAGGQVLSSPAPNASSGVVYSTVDSLFEPSSVVERHGLRPDGSTVDGAAQGDGK